MRICLVSREYPPETGGGGIGTYMANLARGLAAKGHRVYVIAQSASLPEREFLEDGVEVHRIRPFRFPTPILNSLFPHTLSRVKYNIRVQQKLKELTGQEGIDIIESANFAAETVFATSLQPALSVVRLVTPLDTVLAMQNIGINFDLKISCMLEKMNTRNAKGLIASSKATGELIRSFYGLESREIPICPLGIRMPESSGIAPLEKKDSVLVLFVGTLSRRKGVDELLEAAGRVLSEFPSAEFVLAGKDSMDDGGGSYAQAAYGRVPRQFRSRIRLAGFLPDAELRRAFVSADIVAVPSLFESFGQVYLEGMSYGKPLVVTGIPSAMEIVLPGETALVVPPKNPAALAEAVLRLCRDPGLRETLGKAGMKRVREHFTADEMVRRTEEIYTMFLGGRGLA